ncbi:S9 family peptidase [Saccharospirillum salsuginis]|uniref:Peptidase S9 n=1 Tax=Saccharospirillum salsuginis TaxID=418750 RepID=A0A918K268_9GAMM|nr:S9 family peptidase [Saccharospirillum salsuginis]GGX43256.1 peptidase S9 [Saccharospirillum salsuginis]
MDANTPLIPRRHIFGNPERACVRISPDGQHLTWLAPLDGVMNIWLAPSDDLDTARPITRDTHRGIQSHLWAPNGRVVLYDQDRDGDENWHIYGINVESGQCLDLTPIDGVAAFVAKLSYHHPDSLVVGLNDRDESLHDLYVINVLTGERRLLVENPGYQLITVDRDFQVRLGEKMEADGSVQRYRFEREEWRPFDRIPVEDSMTTYIVGFENDPDQLLMVDSRDRDTAALVRWNLASGKSETLLSDERADVSDVMIQPVTHTVQAAAVEYERLEWTPLAAGIENDLAYLNTVCDGDFSVVSRTRDDRQWIVAYSSPEQPGRFYRYDRANKTTDFLFNSRPDLENAPLSPMHPVIIPARDGLNLVSYLTLPLESDPDRSGVPSAPLPMVLLVHGGPWGRDSYGPDAKHHWLANRGYAVLSVNFRGSSGFGKAFINAGDREWAGNMHNDLVDAVDWAVEHGIAQRDKVAIMGGSYGGYATLASLTFTPDVFACGVDLVGPANLITLLESIPPYWATIFDMFANRVGDPRTEAGRAFLRESSPLTFVDRICKPLLIGQGANDPRVKQQESDQIVAAMKENDIPVTYALYPDEGHGFVRPENALSFNAIAEHFLATVLGGRVEPIGNDLEGASLHIPEGGQYIQDLTLDQGSST